MKFIPYVIFILISLHASMPNKSYLSKIELIQSKQQHSLFPKSDLDNVSMMEGSHYLNKHQNITINFDKPYGLILMRLWKNSVMNIYAVNPKTGVKANMDPIREGGSKIGVYFGEYIGQAIIVATENTDVSYSQVIFPKDCDYKYLSNTLSNSLSLKSSNYLNGETFCYFNSAKLPITYSFNYSLGSNYLRVLTNTNEDINATANDFFDKTFEIPAFIKVITSSDIKKSYFVNVKMSAANKEKPKYKYNGFVNSGFPSYIVGEKKGTKLSSSAIATIVVASVIFFALAAYALSYLCLSHRHKHRHNHHHNHDQGNNNNDNSNNNNNNNSNTNNNNNSNNTGNNNENNNENADDAQEKELIENGRYKTPAHVNIELISSQFDQKYKSSNPNLFSQKSASHFEADQTLDDVEVGNNGYPLNEYKPPSKGILAPTSISQFSENANSDEDAYEEDDDTENMTDVPFRKVTNSERKKRTSSSK